MFCYRTVSSWFEAAVSSRILLEGHVFFMCFNSEGSLPQLWFKKTGGSTDNAVVFLRSNAFL